MVQYDLIWSDLARFGVVKLDMVWFGWFGLVRFSSGSVWVRLSGFGLVMLLCGFVWRREDTF